MADRIAMRGSMLSHLAWPEPPGEHPDWRVWRATLEKARSSQGRDSRSSNTSESEGESELCRSMTGFVGYKV
jgi:hypothetical protein